MSGQEEKFCTTAISTPHAHTGFVDRQDHKNLTEQAGPEGSVSPEMTKRTIL